MTARSSRAASECHAQVRACIPPPSPREGIGRALIASLAKADLAALVTPVSPAPARINVSAGSKGLVPLPQTSGRGWSSQSLGQEQSWEMLGWTVMKVEVPLLPDKGWAWQRLHFLRN